jgi:hypothetical protein
MPISSSPAPQSGPACEQAVSRAAVRFRQDQEMPRRSRSAAPAVSALPSSAGPAARPAHRLLHVRFDHHRIRAGIERLEHRHRRAHAMNPGDVAAGGDHAAFAAADDHRLVGAARDCRVFPPLRRTRRNPHAPASAYQFPRAGSAADCRRHGSVAPGAGRGRGNPGKSRVPGLDCGGAWVIGSAIENKG